jgi:hypothetical protein
MACNCNKCKPTKNCGCTDTGIVTPCTYTDCSTGSERCADVQCTECVSYCGTSFQVGSTGTLIKIETGERLDSIIQKFALMLSQGVGACTADNLHHAPYNFYATAITKTTATLLWNGESTLTVGISVYYDTITPTGWVLANAVAVAPGVLKYELTGLAPTKNYKIKLISTDAGVATCDSVEILVDTLS